jgi:hypothetical protein
VNAVHLHWLWGMVAKNCKGENYLKINELAFKANAKAYIQTRDLFGKEERLKENLSLF